MTVRNFAGGALAIAIAASAGAQTFTSYGTGCPGSLGTPVLTTAPGSSSALGGTLTYRIQNAPGIVLAMVGVVDIPPGIPLDFLGMPGCSLFVDPLVYLPGVAVGGTADVPLSVPSAPTALGVSLFAQGALFDPPANAFGMTVTQAGESVITSPLAPVITAVTPATAFVGDTVWITGTNFGNDPIDLCVGGIDANGNWTTLRAEVLTPGQQPGEQILQARVVAAPDLGLPFQLHVFRGSGAFGQISPGVRLTSPNQAWIWNGGNPLVNMGTAPGLLISGGSSDDDCTKIDYELDLVNNCITLDLPFDACGGGGYANLTSVTTDLHFNVDGCSLSLSHCDCFLEQATVVPATPCGFVGGLTVAGDVASALNEAFDGKYGDVFDVTASFALVAGEPVGRITIKPNDPACVFTGVGGRIEICCPPCGITAEAFGANSYNADATSGFWSVTNNTCQDIVSLSIDLTSLPANMRFDTDEVLGPGQFNAGFGSFVCVHTYRNNTEFTTGLTFAGTMLGDPACGSMFTGWNGGAGGAPWDFRTLAFSFTGFEPGETFEFDCDTDIDVAAVLAGSEHAGAVVTALLADGTVCKGTLEADPTDSRRASANF